MTKPTYKLLSSAAEIKAAIESIARRGKKLDQDIQVAALSSMQHHADHGDITLINRLVASMPNGSRVNALKAYIETFGAVRYDTESKIFTHNKGKSFDVNEAAKIMWTDFKPEAEYVPINDPFVKFDQLVTQFERDMTEMGEKSKVTPEMIAALKSAKAEALEAGILH